MMFEPNGRPRRNMVAEDANVKQARNRFKNVIKHMVQNNFLQDEESDGENDESRILSGGLSSSYGNRNGSYSFGSPRKRRGSGGSPFDMGGGSKPHQPSFVMKLFDRSVDLAQFDETVPLYPVCRAWMQNKPHQRQNKRDDDADSSVSEMEYQGETDEVYKLPPAEPLPYDEFGNLIRVRVPPPLPPEGNGEPLNLDYDETTAPSPAYLFQTHLERWNLVKQRCKEATAYNEKRFEASFNILRQIHASANQQQHQQQQQTQIPPSQ